MNRFSKLPLWIKKPKAPLNGGFGLLFFVFRLIKPLSMCAKKNCVLRKLRTQFWCRLSLLVETARVELASEKEFLKLSTSVANSFNIPFGTRRIAGLCH